MKAKQSFLSITILLWAIALALVFSASCGGDKPKQNTQQQPQVQTGGTPMVAVNGTPDVTGAPTPPCQGQQYYQTLPVPCVPKQWNFSYTTPKGVQVFADEDIMVERRDVVFQMIDYGIDNLLAATGAKFPNWNKAIKHSDFRIGYIAPQSYDGTYPPDLLYGGMYNTAGTVMGFNNDSYTRLSNGQPMIMILPNQNVAQWKHTDYGMEAVWNEGEHYREILNDWAVASKYFITTDVHQHHPMPANLQIQGYGLTPRPQGLISQKSRTRCIFLKEGN